MNTQDPSLDRYLDTYRQLIEDLEQKNKQIDSKQALKILTARDDLHITLEQQKPVSIDLLEQVIKLDDRFRDNAIRLTAAINKNSNGELDRLRESVNPSVEAWWWRLESIESPTNKHWFNSVLKIVTLIVWVVNISLGVNIASRFGGAGAVGFFEPLPLILPGIITFISAGQIPIVRSILKWITPEYRWINSKHYVEKTKLLAPWGMLIIIYLLDFGINIYSKQSNFDGRDKFKTGDFSGAEKDYKRSISLDGRNAAAHFDLGNLYEEWLETEDAKKQYKMAIKYKHRSAYNNLGRLYIKEKKYPQAGSLLEVGVKEPNDETVEDLENEKTNYALSKNLGWVRLEQKRYEQAETHLNKAIDITTKPENKELINNSGAAHCLLAQTLEQLKPPKKAMSQWEKCKELLENQDKDKDKDKDEDEDTWLYLATQKLDKQKAPKETNAKPPKVK